MQNIKNYLKNIKTKSEEEKHNFAILIAGLLTILVAVFVLLSWYLQFFDLPIKSSILTWIVSWF